MTIKKSKHRAKKTVSNLSNLVDDVSVASRNTNISNQGSDLDQNSYEPIEYVTSKISTIFENQFEKEKERFVKEMNNTIKDIQDSFEQHRDREALADHEKPVIINDVRVNPGKMIFKDAYDGKSYNQTLTITNCGKHSVTVRIFPPTSQAFKIKPARIRHVLSSGISLVRKVKFLYTKPTAIPQAMMDIYINNTCYRYEFLVVTCYTRISVTPIMIDFGDIDIDMLSTVKFLTFTNSGTKQAQYSIDLGRNQMELIVHPMKGTVQPGESKKITVEVFGTAPGEFKQEFWIKTEPLKRIFIQGNFVVPSLTVDYPLGDRNFLILNFPKTFVGVRQQRNVVIKNHSSTNAVFCVMGRTQEGKCPLRDAQQKDINYKQFYVNPTEGRLHSHQQYIMGITFVPQNPRNRPDYYICSLIVDAKRCRVGNTSKPIEPHIEPYSSGTSPLLDAISVISCDEHSDPEEEVMPSTNKVTILLYGEVEIPNITIKPKKLHLNNLRVNECHVEPLKILNNSKTLPLIIKYNKIACVEMEPKTILLPPSQEVDITLRLKPSKMGDTIINIIFDVLYRQHEQVYNIETVTLNVFYTSQHTEHLKLLKRREAQFTLGITPLITNEVGYKVDDVRFNSKIEKPRQAVVDQKWLALDKNNDALIAFPNDRPKCLRPWRNPVPCKSMFAKLPRVITEFDADFDLSSKEKLLRDTTQTYYKNYIKCLTGRHTKTLDIVDTLADYVTTNEKLSLMQNLKLNTECSTMLEAYNRQALFIPLAPYELHDVYVTPKFIQLGRLAAHTQSSSHFNIENKNEFPIHIAIRAMYTSITIRQEQFILAPNSQKNITFTYNSEGSGTHHIPMFVILNFFHVLDVTVLATIVSKTVKCITKDIMIVPTEKTAFLELRNPINSDVKFMIDTTFFHLESFPSSGVIPAKGNMTCTITFNPEVGYVPVKEICVVSESGAKELVDVHFERKRALVSMSTAIINFGQVPLNTEVSQDLEIKNNSDHMVPVYIEFENSDLFPELRINPTRALLWQKGDTIIKFTVKFKEVVIFNAPIKIVIQYEYPQYISVKGEVVFPDVGLNPSLLKLPKIPSGSVVKTPFRMSNFCLVPIFFSFKLQDFPEFVVRTKTGEGVPESVTLEAKERKDFYLEFSPQEPVAYCIYLPYVINGIVGPPELNQPDSLICSNYLTDVKNEYKISKEISSKMQVIKVLCTASKKWLNFSCLTMEFCSFDQSPQEFVVTNISSASHEITFKMANTELFHCTPSDDNIVTEDNNFTTILAPEESSKITIEFHPLEFGTFTTEVSIYVKDYSETQFFNQLKLSGTKPEPQMIISEKSCSFLPIRLGLRMEKSFTLELYAHTCGGDVQIDCESPHLSVWFLKREQPNPMKLILYFTVVFGPEKECIVETTVKFSCPCLASTEMEVYACCDYSLIINFMADPEVISESTYPLFPTVDDKSSYAAIMHAIVPIVERWLYTQGYMLQNYYKIPEDIARYPVDVATTKQKAILVKKSGVQLPLVQLLINLIDESILKYIENGYAKKNYRY